MPESTIKADERWTVGGDSEAWSTDYCDSGPNVSIGIRGPKGVVGFAVSESYGDDEVDARAAVMAAAPALLAFAKAHEAWEADLVINGDWSSGTVCMNQDQHDRAMELQAMRNKAIALAKA